MLKWRKEGILTVRKFKYVPIFRFTSLGDGPFLYTIIDYLDLYSKFSLICTCKYFYRFKEYIRKITWQNVKYQILRIHSIDMHPFIDKTKSQFVIIYEVAKLPKETTCYFSEHYFFVKYTLKKKELSCPVYKIRRYFSGRIFQGQILLGESSEKFIAKIMRSKDNLLETARSRAWRGN